MSCMFQLYFLCKKAENKYGGDPSNAKHTSTTPLHDSRTYSAHFKHTHISWFMQNIFSDMINEQGQNVSNHD